MQNKVSEKVQDRVFAIIFKRPENSECADCSVKGPRWASLDYGILICMNCAGAHRALGPSITRVRSTKLDGWFQEHIDMMEGMGNGVANSYYEYSLTKSYSKPSASASLETLIKFVNDKYVKKLFIPSNGAPDPKTAFLAHKQALKPYYFDDQHNTNTSDTLQSQETKIVQGGAPLGDLLDMDQDEFQDFQQPVEEINTDLKQTDQPNLNSLSNLSVYGSASTPVSFTSFSPEKQQQQQNDSAQSLNFMNLYNQNPQVDRVVQQQGQQQQHVNKYACLQNVGRQQQNHNQNFSQPQHQQGQPQHQQGWPQGHSYQTTSQQSLQQLPFQQPQPNQPVNIMNLYGQAQQQQNVHTGYRQTNSTQYQ